MGYCDGRCEYLERDKRHTCAKYGVKLGYYKQTGNISFTAHMQCSICEKDEWIKELEAKLQCDHVNNKCLHESCEKCDLKKDREQELEQYNALLHRLAEFISKYDIDEAICKHRPFNDTDCGANGRDCKECIIEHFKTNS